jgi:CelD/BcsL family acetyltransferase involved in cellulose biosynthesis
MRVERITSWPELNALRDEWNALAGSMPLRSWEWLATWWKFYESNASSTVQSRGAAPHRELCVLAVYDQPSGPLNCNRRLLGIAPWYIERSAIKGRVVRWLGDGEVCTDHSSLICESDNIESVAGAIASSAVEQFDDWDSLELDAIDSDNEAITTLVSHLKEAGCSVSESVADSYWEVDLPATWDEYLVSISKSHRKQLRQLERRVLDGDRVNWHPVHTNDDLSIAWEVLVDLHQRRRQSLGESGCFASQAFHDFHKEVAQLLLQKGQLRVSWLELDGIPAAAEYHVASGATTYAYQGGVDPDRLSGEPGRLSTILCMQQAIAEQHTRFDFLRGDEPYKAHWRATPRATCNYRIVPPRRLARLRGSVLNVADTLHDWARQAVQLTSFGS